MILSNNVAIKISSSNKKYWESKGYTFDYQHPRWGKVTELEVRVRDLLPQSNVDVECWCERCEAFYMARFCRNTEYCDSCTRSNKMRDNSYGSALKGTRLPQMSGDKHPRWNPNKPEFKKYQANVYRITRLQDISILKDSDKPRTLCGVDGGYQLDHIIPVKHGFENNVPPEVIGHISNLQFLPWEVNRNKGDKHVLNIS